MSGPYVTSAEMAALRRRSNGAGLARLAGHLALLTATGGGVLLATGPWLPVAMVGHGIVLIALFAPLHETIHRTAFRSRALNDGVARMIGALLVLPAGYFRHFHFAHHRHTQDPACDPELAVPKPATLGGYLWTVSGLPYWIERIGTTIRHALGRTDGIPFVADRDRPDLTREARAVLVAYGVVAVASIAAQSTAALTLWVIPALLGQPALRLYLMAEHAGCPLVPDMTVNTRTTVSNAAVRYLMWNMPYHVEHHLYPAVPFHALPAVHGHVAPHLKVTAPGYISFHRELIAAIRRGGAAESRAAS